MPEPKLESEGEHANHLCYDTASKTATGKFLCFGRCNGFWADKHSTTHLGTVGWFPSLTRAYDNNGRCPRQKFVFGILQLTFFT